MLAGIERADLRARLLGQPLPVPLAVAPMAYQRLLHEDGEAAVARAAAGCGWPFVLSMMSSVPVEQVAESGAHLWFQLYWLKDRGALAEVVTRAEASGCQALVLTVDMPVMARRPRDLRRGFALPAGVSAAHLPPTARVGPTPTGWPN